VDTLFDRRITREMLAAMRRATPAARRIGTVVNTHGNGDHCYGNGEVPGAEIIGSRGCVEDLSSAPPSRNATLMRAARVVQALGGAGRVAGRVCNALGLNTVAWLVEATPLALPLFETFEFSGNDVVLPTRIFVDRLSLRVGDRRVELMELGPAHTLGDTVVHLPDERVLFTGDLLFKDAHPLIWQGPVSNWIRACHTLLELEVETVVPGHGPLTDLSGIRETLGYLEWLTAEARARYDAGLTVEQAAREISLEAFRTWLDAERVFVNVHSLYRDFAGDPNPAEILELFAGMARLAREGAHGCH
jgi:glyoxylase-like metal-dependent hydrolase (beta-lactamase superfamily II)